MKASRALGEFMTGGADRPSTEGVTKTPKQTEFSLRKMNIQLDKLRQLMLAW